jgi:hypothetical protein
MSERLAPERIWLEPDGSGTWCRNPSFDAWIEYVRADLTASTPAPGCQQPDAEGLTVNIEPTAEGLWRATSPQDRRLHVVGKTPAGALYAAASAMADLVVSEAPEMQREDAGDMGEPAPGGISTSSEGRRVPASPRPDREALARLIGKAYDEWWWPVDRPADVEEHIADAILASGLVAPSLTAASERIAELEGALRAIADGAYESADAFARAALAATGGQND